MKRRYNQEQNEMRRSHLGRRGLSLGLALLTAITTLWVPELGGVGKVEAAEQIEPNDGEYLYEIFHAPGTNGYVSWIAFL